MGKRLICELNHPEECRGAVNRRHDGHLLCWTHWGTVPAPKVERKPVGPGSAQTERDARVLIRDEIHKRDSIVLGRDPLGNLCRCQMCREAPTWMEPSR